MTKIEQLEKDIANSKKAKDKLEAAEDKIEELEESTK